MYGDLSALIHSPGLKQVFLSEDIDEDNKAFFTAGATLTKKVIVLYSASAADAAETAANSIERAT